MGCFLKAPSPLASGLCGYPLDVFLNILASGLPRSPRRASGVSGALAPHPEWSEAVKCERDLLEARLAWPAGPASDPALGASAEWGLTSLPVSSHSLTAGSLPHRTGSFQSFCGLGLAARLGADVRALLSVPLSARRCLSLASSRSARNMQGQGSAMRPV